MTITEVVTTDRPFFENLRLPGKSIFTANVNFSFLQAKNIKKKQNSNEFKKKTVGFPKSR